MPPITTPQDTAPSAINIAHNPGANVDALYKIPTPTAPFGPTLSGQPNDFVIAITYTGAGLNGPVGIAIDSSGDASAANAVAEAVDGAFGMDVDYAMLIKIYGHLCPKSWQQKVARGFRRSATSAGLAVCLEADSSCYLSTSWLSIQS